MRELVRQKDSSLFLRLAASKDKAGILIAAFAGRLREALGLAEGFFSLARNCDGFSARFAPCLDAIRRHIDDATSRIARLG